MTKTVKKILYLVSGVAVAVAAGLAEKNCTAETSRAFTACHIWCDGFFVSAVLFLSGGILTLVSGFGGFDALKYACIKFRERFSASSKKHSSYFDYVNDKKGKKTKVPVDMLITGFTMLIGAFVCLAFCD